MKFAACGRKVSRSIRRVRSELEENHAQAAVAFPAFWVYDVDGYVDVSTIYTHRIVHSPQT